MKQTGRIVTVTGPSGVGKTTILRSLIEQFPEEYTEIISHTTRTPREGEAHGKTYYFISQEEFDRMKEAGEFLETVHFSGRNYGSSYAEADAKTFLGKNALVILEPHGVEQWQQNYTGPKIHIFVRTPSSDALRERMRRQGRSEEAIASRLEHDTKMFDVAASGYHLMVVNENLELTCKIIRDYIRSVA